MKKLKMFCQVVAGHKMAEKSLGHVYFIEGNLRERILAEQKEKNIVTQVSKIRKNGKSEFFYLFYKETNNRGDKADITPKGGWLPIEVENFRKLNGRWPFIENDFQVMAYFPQKKHNEEIMFEFIKEWNKIGISLEEVISILQKSEDPEIPSDISYLITGESGSA